MQRRRPLWKDWLLYRKVDLVYSLLKLLAQSDEQRIAEKMVDLEEEQFAFNQKVEKLTKLKEEEEKKLARLLPTREETQKEIVSLEREREIYQKTSDEVSERIKPLAQEIANLTEQIEDCEDKSIKSEKEQERYTIEKMRNEILLESSADLDKLREINSQLYGLYQKLDSKAESRVLELAIRIGELKEKIITRERLLLDLRERKANNLNEGIGQYSTKRIGELKTRIEHLQSQIKLLEA